jgi:Golgi nucleoside diphosphatase
MIMILMLVAFMFPSGGFRESIDHTQSSATSSSLRASSGGSGMYVYNIVLDAGSTGSRIHIFKFKQVGKQLLLQSDGFHQLKPGLSSFADNPKAAADSLKPLMQEALKAVPKEQQVRRVTYPPARQTQNRAWTQWVKGAQPS